MPPMDEATPVIVRLDEVGECGGINKVNIEKLTQVKK
jgi:hypothetical protein